MTKEKSNADWRAMLSPEAFRVAREGGTEAPYSGEYDDHFEAGTYGCVCCGVPLFTSQAKFKAHCGWPAFDAALEEKNVVRLRNESYGRVRVEVRCASCDAHLGHVFQDGPTDTGERFCINSVVLQHKP